MVAALKPRGSLWEPSMGVWGAGTPYPVSHGATPGASEPWSQPSALSSRLQQPWPRQARPAQRPRGRAPLRRGGHREPAGRDRGQHLLRARPHHGPALGEGRGRGGVPPEAPRLQGEAGGRPVRGGEWLNKRGPESGVHPRWTRLRTPCPHASPRSRQDGVGHRTLPALWLPGRAGFCMGCYSRLSSP